MSYLFLNGNLEPFSDTIRLLIATNWKLKRTPAIISEGGEGTQAGTITTNAAKFLQKEKGLTISIYDGDTTDTEMTKDFVYGFQIVHIDITTNHVYYDDKSEGIKAMHEINRIISSNQTGPYIKSRDGKDSHLFGFTSYIPSWNHITEEDENIITQGWYGEIGCRYQFLTE